MTIKEARIHLENLKSDAELYDEEIFKLHLADTEIEALDMAIKALRHIEEQKVKAKLILGKARAEIESTMKYQYAIGEDQYAEGFEKSLEIIDKYNTEK